uniref:Uncharacterized protein n=1 Tax=Chromera velia CCMP2878 TaxID=1169474 RepID=A0A0G4HZF2_9ALVE|eukprot:Cvel_33980.t1-p1 / transcript=Cvel_33980.t1 / gene=Cvel_33980 / organism=Chromera_velia_CCMP2878 / gene_product=hypothetical protein / transcript_product=hypothetical protein / location=Cvel_scaffold5685:324-1093(+) / protein_length=135 / sequence_SO=supercontig / SO=protein_coding / is_pseudo=false
MGGDSLNRQIGKFVLAMKELKEVAQGRQGPISDAEAKTALSAWNNGRLALNAFSGGINRLVIGPSREAADRGTEGFSAYPNLPEIPADESNYLRDRKGYNKLKKAIVKCQNGGLGANVCGALTSEALKKNSSKGT